MPTAASDQPFSSGPQPNLNVVYKHPAGVEHELRQTAARDHRHQPPRALQLRQPAQRSDRIRRRSSRMNVPALRGSDSGQHEIAVEQIDQRQAAGDEERQAQADRAQSPPITGPRMKPTPNIAPSRPKRFARPSGGVCRRRRRWRRPGWPASRRSPGARQSASTTRSPARWRKAQRETAEPEQQHRPAAVVVRERAQNRRSEKFARPKAKVTTPYQNA